MNISRLNKSTVGLTLIEILVVVAIIGILSAVIAVNAIESGKLSRDAKRQADLRSLQSAIELYKNKEGRYPPQCEVVNSVLAQGWSGQLGTDYECTNGNTQYISGLAPKYISVLPRDPKLNGTNSGYVYRTNALGTVYKIKAQRTVESEVIDYLHEFKACDVRVPSDPTTGNLGSALRDREVIGWCARVNYSGNSMPDSCRANYNQWHSSYGAWGGFEATLGSDDAEQGSTVFVKDTTDVICR